MYETNTRHTRVYIFYNINNIKIIDEKCHTISFKHTQKRSTLAVKSQFLGMCVYQLGTHEICEIHEALNGIVSLFFQQLGFGYRPAGQASLQFPGKVVDVSDSLHRLARRFCTCSRQQQFNILPTFGIDRDYNI